MNAGTSESGSCAILDADAVWARAFGTGSRISLRERFRHALASGSPCDEASLRARVEREHRTEHGDARLAAEARDERERDAAVTCDTALVAYEAKWARRIAKLGRAAPHRWRVPGVSAEEVKDELTLRLIDAVRTKPEERAAHHRAGCEWGLRFVANELERIRADFRLEVITADLSPVLDRRIDEEEAMIEEESARLFARAREQAENSLSRPQRRWLAAMKLTANSGEFFASSGKLNLAAASRLLDKNRSSAVRAFGELSTHFVRELKKLEG